MPRMSGLPRKSEPWTRDMTNFFRGHLNESCRSESNPEATKRIFEAMQEAFKGRKITWSQVKQRERRFRLNDGHKATPWTAEMNDDFEALEPCCEDEALAQATKRILKAMQEAFKGQKITQSQVKQHVRRFRLNGVRKGTLWTAEMNDHLEALEPCREDETPAQATTHIFEAMEGQKITRS